MNEEQNQDTTPVTEPVGEEMKLPENSAPVTEVEEKPVRGPVILLLGLLLLAVLIGLVLWFTNINQSPEPALTTPIERPTPEENNEPESTTAEAQTDNLETVSTSDEITAIEADLEATDIEALDAELEAIEAELEASS